MKKIFQIFSTLLIFTQIVNSQISNEKEFSSLEEALKKPENVFRLNLSNQTLKISNVDWKKFINLEYLSLENNHLNEIPEGITNLKSLKTINLSGNDFKKLPFNFKNLMNLEEVYLNNENNMNLPKTLNTLSKLPKIKSLHLENDNLSMLPKEIYNFKNLELLYLNNNNFIEIPSIDTLDHLKFLDLKDNKINTELRDIQNLNFGLKINL